MMKLRKEAKIGIFGVSMVLVLFWGVNFLKGRDIFLSTATYYSTFENANGLKISSEVILRGLKIGEITDIIYNPTLDTRVIVEFSVSKDYKIPTDSRIVASNKYIISGTVLNLEYGNENTFFNPNDTISAIAAPDVLKIATTEVEDLKTKVNSLVSNINTTLENVNSVLSQQNINNISSTLDNLDNIVSKDIKGITSNLNKVTKTLGDNTQRIDNIIANVEAVSDSLKEARIATLVHNANRTVEELNTTIAKLNKTESSAGKLLNDTALYDSLVTASHNLSLLLEDIKVNPKRYINVSVFGGKNKNK